MTKKTRLTSAWVVASHTHHRDCILRKQICRIYLRIKSAFPDIECTLKNHGQTGIRKNSGYKTTIHQHTGKTCSKAIEILNLKGGRLKRFGHAFSVGHFSNVADATKLSNSAHVETLDLQHVQWRHRQVLLSTSITQVCGAATRLCAFFSITKDWRCTSRWRVNEKQYIHDAENSVSD